jgi:hypothetical protein
MFQPIQNKTYWKAKSSFTLFVHNNSLKQRRHEEEEEESSSQATNA